jgi:colanic acid/amylovoran biosynthesis glycosyltransferase
MATVLVITAQFPFPGEPFLELEVAHWSRLGDRIVFAPASAPSGAAFPLPPGVSLDLSLSRRSMGGQVRAVLAALFHRIFWRELAVLKGAGYRSPAGLRHALRATALTLWFAREIRRMVRRLGGVDLVYCYWNDVESCGAVLASARGGIGAVVARAHGSDLYARRRPHGYLPLRHQCLGELDAVFPISDDGRGYLLSEYALPSDRVITTRLGVAIPLEATGGSAPAACHVLTISACNAVKRLDKAVAAIAAAAEQSPAKLFAWTHLGGGELLAELRSHAEERLGPLPNVTFQLRGPLPHEEVLRILDTGGHDLVLNTSESEGIPMALMEAMARGVPAVAPDVGGIRELVGPGRGWLMTSDPEIAEIADCILRASSSTAPSLYRRAAREHVAQHFNADVNYSTFVRHCQAVIKSAR